MSKRKANNSWMGAEMTTSRFNKTIVESKAKDSWTGEYYTTSKTKKLRKFGLTIKLTCWRVRTALHLNLTKQPLIPSESACASPFFVAKKGQEKATCLDHFLRLVNGTWDYSFKSIVERKANNPWMGEFLKAKQNNYYKITEIRLTTKLTCFLTSRSKRSWVISSQQETENWAFFCAFIGDQQTIKIKSLISHLCVKCLSSEWRIYLYWNLTIINLCLDLHADISSDHFYIKYILG